MEKIIIIGASAAGISAVKELIKSEKEFSITLISKENCLPYYRPLLSEYLVSESVSEKSTFSIFTEEMIKKGAVKFLCGATVSKVDTENKQVMLRDRESLAYDKLIIAAGADVFLPGDRELILKQKNIFCLRSVEDADLIKKQISSKKKIGIIGSGLLGLEIAYFLAESGHKVYIADIAERLLPQFLDCDGSEILKSIIRKFDIELFLNCKNISFNSKDSVVDTLIVDSENIPVDTLIYCTGVRPVQSIDFNNTIEYNRGITVNSKMQTSAEDVYACGDIVNIPNVPKLWMPAVFQGKTAALNILGADQEFKPDIYPAVLNAFKTRVFSAGTIPDFKSIDNFTSKSSYDHEKQSFKRIFFKEEKIIAAYFIGDIREAMSALKEIKANRVKQTAHK